MFPVQILIVLSMIIIINQAATFNYDYQKSNTSILSDVDKIKADLILYDKKYNAKGNYSNITRSYNFPATDLIKKVKTSKINYEKWCYVHFGWYSGTYVDLIKKFLSDHVIMS